MLNVNVNSNGKEPSSSSYCYGFKILNNRKKGLGSVLFSALVLLFCLGCFCLVLPVLGLALM